MPLLGATFPLLLNVAPRRYDALAIKRMGEEFETYFRRGARYAVLSVQPPGSPVPGAGERKLIADWTSSESVQKHARELCVGAVAVIDGPLMRGALTAVLWFRRLPFPLDVVATPAKGVDSCLAQLIQAGVPLGGPEAQVRAHALSLLEAALKEPP